MFIIIARELYIIKKSKNKNDVATLVFFSSIYIIAGRTSEALYTPLLSDYSGMFDILGQLYLPFDIVSLSLFMIFAVNVLLAEELTRSEIWLKNVLFLGFSATSVALLGKITNYFEIPGYDIFVIVGIIIAVLVILIALVISARIFHLEKLVSENRSAVKLIGFLYLLLLSLVIQLLI